MSNARDFAARVPVDGALSNRNLIINGAMQVAQRGTSSTFGQSDKGYKTVDRFQFWEQGTPTATFNLTREGDGPNGFKYSTKLACSTANTSGIPTSVHMYMQYNVEAQDMYQLAWGTTDAKPATLSFWAKSNTAGTYVVSLAADDGTDLDYYTAPYDLDGSGNWQYITIVIPANTITQVSNTTANATGLYIKWIIQSSTTYSSGTSLTGWTESPSTSQLEAGQNADVGATVGNYWQITGVQLELGDTATPFEHRSYGDELARCQRYYYEVQANSWILVGDASNTGVIRGLYNFPVEMRVDPTCSSFTLSHVNGGWTHTRTVVAPKTYGINTVNYTLNLLPANQMGWNAGAITCDAEL